MPSADVYGARPGGPAQGRLQRTTGFWSAVGHADVVRAIEEYDRLGQERFLAEHGFGRATAYLLIHGGRGYDSKAILGVAYKFATGVQIGPHDFSGGVNGAAGVLRKLGFEVRDTRTSAGQLAEERASPAPRSGTMFLRLSQPTAPCGLWRFPGRGRAGTGAAGADLLWPQGARRPTAVPVC